MGNAYFNNAGNYLIDTLFSLYIGAVVLRFLFQLLDVDYHNPVTQFLVKITAPILKPLRTVIPKSGKIDLASLVLALLLTIAKFFLKLSVTGQNASLAGIVVFSIADLLSVLLTIILWAMIIRVIMSWVNPDPNQPIVRLLIQITEPIMAPARRLIPPVGGLDLSPIAVFILISLTRMLAVAPLMDFASKLM